MSATTTGDTVTVALPSTQPTRRSSSTASLRVSWLKYALSRRPLRRALTLVHQRIAVKAARVASRRRPAVVAADAAQLSPIEPPSAPSSAESSTAAANMPTIGPIPFYAPKLEELIHQLNGNIQALNTNIVGLRNELAANRGQLAENSNKLVDNTEALRQNEAAVKDNTTRTLENSNQLREDAVSLGPLSDELKQLLDLLTDKPPDQPGAFSFRVVGQVQVGDQTMLQVSVVNIPAVDMTKPANKDFAKATLSVSIAGAADQVKTWTDPAFAGDVAADDAGNPFQGNAGDTIAGHLVYEDVSGNKSMPRDEAGVLTDTFAPDQPNEFGFKVTGQS